MAGSLGVEPGPLHPTKEKEGMGAARPGGGEYEALREPPPLAKRIALFVVVGLIVWLGVALGRRIDGAIQDKKRIEAERQEVVGGGEALPFVEAVHPEVVMHEPMVRVRGELEPIQAADIGFEVPGRLARVEVRLGDEVRAGQMLAVLDRASIGAQAQASQAAIGVAQANVEMLRERVELLRGLVASGAAPERDLSAAERQLAIAEAQLRQAQAGLRTVSTAAEDHVLRAPFEGVVTRVPSGVGQVVVPGVPVFRIEDLRSFRLRATVSEEELSLLRVGMEARLEGKEVRGQLKGLVRSLDPQSRRAPIEIFFPNDGTLVAHAVVRAWMKVGEAVRALRIPASAVREDQSVLVVGEGGILVAKAVQVKAEGQGNAIVLSGLGPEDLVIVQPARFRPGDRVRVLPEPQQAAMAERK
ncbi:MAG: efflux RND transporter periplasmic adaptor subunit [Sandaracinaceae bacterium]|nr:efflux RND transporter periplasmic adaptor subunit [Sandaracinaceae bacterium]